MPYEELQEPVRGPSAFESQDDPFVQSQAAILLLLRSQLAFAREYVAERVAEGLAPDEPPELVGAARTRDLAAEDLERFPVPWVRDGGAWFDFEPQLELLRRFGSQTVNAVLKQSRQAVSAILPSIASELFEDRRSSMAALVLEVCLRH